MNDEPRDPTRGRSPRSEYSGEAYRADDDRFARRPRPAPRSRPAPGRRPSGQDRYARGSTRPPGRRPSRANRAAVRRRRNVAVVALVVALFAALYGVASLLSGGGGGSDAAPTAARGGRVSFTVAPGQGVSQIAGALADAGIVTSADDFRTAAASGGQESQLQAGTYTFARPTAPPEVVKRMVLGPAQAPVVGRKVVVPEGFAAQQTAEALGRAGVDPKAYLKLVRETPIPEAFRAGTSRKRGLEGFLFPATYDVGRDTTPKDFVDQQLAAFDQNTQGLDFNALKSRNITPYDALIVASMIEREAFADDERAKIASVIYNRIKARMPLQIDAAVSYGVHPGDWRAPTTDDLASNSPYNVYKVGGLPPTPIASPRRASIEAALAPASTDFVYYFSPPGTQKHLFFTNLDDFNAAIARAGVR